MLYNADTLVMGCYSHSRLCDSCSVCQRRRAEAYEAHRVNVAYGAPVRMPGIFPTATARASTFAATKSAIARGALLRWRQTTDKSEKGVNFARFEGEPRHGRMAGDNALGQSFGQISNRVAFGQIAERWCQTHWAVTGIVDCVTPRAMPLRYGLTAFP